MIQTNNDLEGLHRSWNVKGKGGLQFYALVELMYTLGKDFERTTILLSGGNKLRRQSKTVALKNEKLDRFWKEVERRRIGKEPNDAFEMVNAVLTIQRPRPKIGPNTCDHTFFDPETIPENSDSE